VKENNGMTLSFFYELEFTFLLNVHVACGHYCKLKFFSQFFIICFP
jgi:hypothetical protein